MVKKITNSKIVSLYLNDYGKKYYLREIASLLKKPHQTIKPYVEKLSKERILIKIERKNLLEFGLNLNDKRICDYITIAEKDKVQERLQDDAVIRILFEKLSDAFNNNSFVIFGSSVDGLKKESDIDVLVVGTKNVTRVLEDFKKIYNKKIHKIQIDNINKITDALSMEVYKKHLILNNTEQITRYFLWKYGENKLV